jgi:hypothetical protein
MTTLTANIAAKYNVAEAAITEIREWAHVYFAVIKGIGARFVSKKLAPKTKSLVSAEWQVGETLCKAEYKCEYAFFGGKPCFATYKQVTKKIVGQAPRITWELVQNVAADEFLAQVANFPSGKFIYA